MKRFILVLSFIASVLVLFGQGHTHIPPTFRFNSGPITIECKANEIEQHYTRYGFTTELFTGVDLVTSAYGRKRLEAPLYMSEKQGWVTIVGRGGESVYFSLGYVPAYSNSTTLFNDISDCLSSVNADVVVVADAGAFYSSQNLEGVLQEVGDTLTALRNDVTAIAAGASDGVATSGAYDAGNEEIDITVASPGSDFAIDVSDLATDSDVVDSLAQLRSEIPTNVSDLTNDAGYLTSETDAIALSALDDSTSVLRMLIDNATPDSALFVTLTHLADSTAAIRADISNDGVVTSGTVSGSTLTLSRSEGLSDVDIDVSSLAGGGGSARADSVYTEYIGKAIIADTIYVLGTGQSNMDGRDNTGDLSDDNNLEKWDGSAWVKALETNNTPVLSFARSLEADCDCLVRYFKVAVGGTPISQWLNGNVMMDSIEAQISNSGVAGVDVILWHQGEADRNRTYAEYYEDLDSLYAYFQRQDYVFPETAFVLGGLYKGADATHNFQDSTLHDFATNTAGVLYADSYGLSAIDGVHFAGTAVDSLGARYYDVWRRGSGFAIDKRSSTTGVYYLQEITQLDIPSSGPVTATQNWSAIDEGTTHNGDNYLYFSSLTSTDSIWSIGAVSLPYSYNTDSVRFKIYFDGAGRGGVSLRSSSGTDGYYAQFNSDGASSANRVRIYEINSGVYSLLDDVTGYTMSQDTPYIFSVGIADDVFTIRDSAGVEIVSASLTPPLKTGRVILASGHGASSANTHFGELTYPAYPPIREQYFSLLIPSEYAEVSGSDLTLDVKKVDLTEDSTAPTPSAGDDDTSIATTEFVQGEIETATSGTEGRSVRFAASGFEDGDWLTSAGVTRSQLSTAIGIPDGGNATRPGSPQNGDLRFNTDGGSPEIYMSGDWFEFEMEGYNKSGMVSGTPDGNGDLTVTHNLPLTPTSIQVSAKGTTIYHVQPHSESATTFKIRVWDSSNAIVTSGTVNVYWTARN